MWRGCIMTAIISDRMFWLHDILRPNKPEGHGFDSWWGHWIFQLTKSFQVHDGPGIDSASNRNEYQESFWWGKGQPAHKLDNLTAIR
jgi:hypothetical protein